MTESKPRFKFMAAESMSLELFSMIKPKMKIGLGTGKTVESLILQIAPLLKKLSVQCLVTSDRTLKFIQPYELEVIKTCKNLDLTFDGADWIDKDFNLIKGYGGALSREKLAAEISKKYVIVAGENKLTSSFSGKVLTVEILPFLHEKTLEQVRKITNKVRLKTINGEPFITDNKGLCLECTLPNKPNLSSISYQIKRITGVVNHGLFLNFNPVVLIGKSDGSTISLNKN